MSKIIQAAIAGDTSLTINIRLTHDERKLIQMACELEGTTPEELTQTMLVGLARSRVLAFANNINRRRFNRNDER